jgi:hypothetical protein
MFYIQPLLPTRRTLAIYLINLKDVRPGHVYNYSATIIYLIKSKGNY